jgi:tetratricopeptide (TPR) repeat protein
MKKSMKRALFMLVCFSSAGLWAQQPAPSSKAGQTPAKRVAEAKTAQEFKDYNAAYAAAGGAALEKAADDFAAKYPASELKIFIYEKAMHEYQAETNQPKVLASAEKVLQLDPENVIALVLTANVLSDSLSEADPDRGKKIAEIKKNSSHALQIVDGNFTPLANATPEQVAAHKKTLQFWAHSALGITALKTGDDAGAEKELKAAAEANPGQPDPYIWFNLALAQDHQKKYDEALVSVKRAIQAAASNPDIAEQAKGEQSRLLTLTGGAAPAPEKLPTPAPK